MEYLYYTASVLKGVTYVNKTYRKEIVEEKEDRYILKEYADKVSTVFKDNMLYHSVFDYKEYEIHIETPELLEKYEITELESKYSNLIYKFLHAEDHDMMKRIVEFLEGIL